MNEIDIIIPMYNSSKFIETTLDSFLKQTYKKFRLILIDDGSTDNTVEIVKNYKKDKNLDIKLIEQKNLGREAARNSGIDEADAKYMIFFDSDDIMEEKGIEKLYKSIENKKCELVYGSYIRKYKDEDIIFLEEEKLYPRYEAINKYFLKQLRLGIGNTILLSEIVKKNKIYFKKFEYGEDNHFFRKYLFFVKNAYALKDVIFKYVQREDSTVHSKFRKEKFNVLDSINDTEEFYRENEKDKRVKIRYLNVYYNVEYVSLIHTLYLQNVDYNIYSNLFQKYKKPFLMINLFENMSVKNLKKYIFSKFPKLYFIALKKGKNFINNKEKK